MKKGFVGHIERQWHMRQISINSERSDGVIFPAEWIAMAPFPIHPDGEFRVSPITFNATHTKASVRLWYPGCNHGAWDDVVFVKQLGIWIIQSQTYGGEGWC